MRMHIELDEALAQELDRLAGPRRRTAFIRDAIEHALDRERRQRAFRSAAGSISDTGHEWDDDPADWVRAQRRSDPRRSG